MPRLLAALCVLCFSALAAQAQDRAIHYGLLVTNDALGDGKDRWRTGSFASSLAYAPGWSGTLPGGESFNGFRTFREILKQDRDTVVRAIAQKLLIYGTGRPLTPADRPVVDAVAEAAGKHNDGLRSMIAKSTCYGKFSLCLYFEVCR